MALEALWGAIECLWGATNLPLSAADGRRVPLIAAECRRVPWVLALQVAARLADGKRQEAASWSERRQQQEDEYLSRARANKAEAERTKASARAEKASVLRQRRAAASRERANDVLVTEEKARILASNRKEVAAVYSKRYVSRSSASRWEGSPLHRLHTAAFWGGGASTAGRMLGWAATSSAAESPPSSPATAASSPDRPNVRV